jgi:hypothetical protein
MPKHSFDRDKVRAVVRQLDGADLLVLLDRAIDLLPLSKLPKLVEDYAWPKDLRSDGVPPTDLLETIRGFHADSLSGKYREAFNVNSRNYMQKSKGTQRWIAECQRLLDLCVAASRGDEHRETRTAFELLFDLLVRIDDGDDDIVFFADEAGSWQVGVVWTTVMPAWFRTLSATSAPEEYASAVHAMVSHFAHYQADKLLPAARKAANPEQEAALSRLPPPKRTYERARFDLG